MNPIRPTTTLIITTYNWHEALNLVLKSVLRQSVLPDEVLIADDGSTNETRALINEYTLKFSIPLRHIWHEDKGFRKTLIMNRAIAQANCDYIIQIDGDIILHKHFIHDHLKIRKVKTFVHGSRVFLNKGLSQQALESGTIDFSVFNFKVKNKFNQLYFPIMGKLFGFKSKNLKRTRGCNFAAWRKDLLEVNGYDTSMSGWGLEDTELSARLLNKGLSKGVLKFSGIQYHLYHRESSRDKLNTNRIILNCTIKDKKDRCIHGIDML